MSDFGIILTLVIALCIWITYIKCKRNNKIRKATEEIEQIAVCPPDGKHKWSKWTMEKYTTTRYKPEDDKVTSKISILMQQRKCEKCGFMEIEKLETKNRNDN